MRRLRTLAEAWGPLPDEWAARRYMAKPSEVAAEKPPRTPLPPVLLELEEWLGSEGLTQRQKLESLRSQWLSRLSDAAVRAEALRLIRKAINSKKLVEERDALLRALE